MWTITKILEIILIFFVVRYLENFEWLNNNGKEVAENYISRNEIYIPYQVAIVTKPNNKSSILCGGSIISERYILTAAHCLEGSQFAAITFNVTSSGSTINPQFRVDSERFKIHPKWRPNILLNDIALINVSPHHAAQLKINKLRLSTNIEITNRMGILYGWVMNLSQENARLFLQIHQVTVIENEECAKLFGKLVRESNVCTKPSKYENGCHGFSGGSLVVDGTQIGIVSFGTTDCRAGYPTVHTRVSKYKRWIRENSDLLFEE